MQILLMKSTACWLLSLIYISSFGQKLDTSKSELNSKSSKTKTTSSSSSSSNSSSFSNDDNVFLPLLFNITFGVFKYGAIGDYKNEDHLYNSLTTFPYYNKSAGNFDASDSLVWSKTRFRLDLEDSFVFSNVTLYGNHLKAKIRPFQYFYFQTDYHQLFENDNATGTHACLSLFQFNVNYDRIRFEKFNFGWNLGATYVGNEVKKAGFAYGLNADYFMGEHISFSGSAKWSSINSYPVNAFEIQGKYHQKNYFFSLGFEHLKIATPTYNFIAIGGGIYF